MCGIVGYTGSEQATPILLKGLGRLEYRGYDSAGIAVTDQSGRFGRSARRKDALAIWKTGSKRAL